MAARAGHLRFETEERPRLHLALNNQGMLTWAVLSYRNRLSLSDRPVLAVAPQQPSRGTGWRIWDATFRGLLLLPRGIPQRVQKTVRHLEPPLLCPTDEAIQSSVGQKCP